MRRPCYFAVVGLPVRPWSAAPPGSRGAGFSRPGSGAAGLPHDPMTDLLRGLRGRELVLQVGSQRVAGRLVTADPVILVGSGGQATQVRSEAILAVDF